MGECSSMNWGTSCKFCLFDGVGGVANGVGASSRDARVGGGRRGAPVPSVAATVGELSYAIDAKL